MNATAYSLLAVAFEGCMNVRRRSHCGPRACNLRDFVQPSMMRWLTIAGSLCNCASRLVRHYNPRFRSHLLTKIEQLRLVPAPV